MDLPWLTLISDPLGLLWRMVIRPPRSKYTLAELGPPKFRIGAQGFERRDLQLVNDRGHRLECSHFVPLEDLTFQSRSRLPCVIYLHGSRSSRLEAIHILHDLLPRRITVFCMDCSGSGHSEGDYISLGHYEEQDVRVAIDYLRSCSHVSSIGLWGRSMGAAVAVLRAAQDETLAACVMDSCFSSLPTVIRELVNNLKIKIPDFLVDLAYQCIRTEIKDRAKFDIDDLRPLSRAPQCSSPALFAVAEKDTFVLPHHTYDLYRTWGGRDRTLVTLGGRHDTPRPRKFLKFASEFLQKRLLAAEALEVGGAALERADMPAGASSVQDVAVKPATSGSCDIGASVARDRQQWRMRRAAAMQLRCAGSIGTPFGAKDAQALLHNCLRKPALPPGSPPGDAKGSAAADELAEQTVPTPKQLRIGGC